MKRKGWFGVAAPACAAPLWLVGAAGVVGIAAISADTWICSTLILLVVGILYWRVRQRRLQSRGDTNAAHCAMDCECKSD